MPDHRCPTCHQAVDAAPRMQPQDPEVVAELFARANDRPQHIDPGYEPPLWLQILPWAAAAAGIIGACVEVMAH